MINQSGSRTQSLRALLTLLAIAVFVGTLPAKDAFPVGIYASDDFTIAFRSDGTFRVSEKGDAVVEGTYTVEADRITLTDKQGRYACVTEGPGKYTWKQNGQTLAFTKVDDSCTGRERVLTSGPLTKQNPGVAVAGRV